MEHIKIKIAVYVESDISMVIHDINSDATNIGEGHANCGTSIKLNICIDSMHLLNTLQTIQNSDLAM